MGSPPQGENTGDGNFETVNADGAVIGPYHYAGYYDGVDPDARLDAALSAVSPGDTIYLENATYSANRTIGKDDLVIQGSSYSSGNGGGTTITGGWTVGQVAGVTIKQLRLEGSFTVNSNLNNGSHQISEINGAAASVTIDTGRTIVSQCDNINVTFNSGTADGLVDTCTETTVTDNGANTVGDVT